MRIGVDLGGTKIEAVVLAGDGAILIRKRVPTPAHDYHAIVNAVADLILDLEQVVGETCTVGVGMPGTFSPRTGLLRNSNTTALNGRPLNRDLEALLARELRFENDANCFALSEARDGAARDQSPVFGVIIGTGTGGGIVVDGRIVRGANAIAGEWGHNPLPWPRDDERPGAPCYCGLNGCIETFLSGAGFRRGYTGLSGRDLTVQAIVERANHGEAAALDALRLYEDRLARSLAAVVNVIDPAVIVLGGGLSNIGSLYRQVPALLCDYVFTDHLDLQLRAAAHGDSSGVRGAAWLWDVCGL